MINGLQGEGGGYYDLVIVFRDRVKTERSPWIKGLGLNRVKTERHPWIKGLGLNRVKTEKVTMDKGYRVK